MGDGDSAENSGGDILAEYDMEPAQYEKHVARSGAWGGQVEIYGLAVSGYCLKGAAEIDPYWENSALGGGAFC